jgi:EAL and modified HD-GYP domain-containing signal transduction protein
MKPWLAKLLGQPTEPPVATRSQATSAATPAARVPLPARSSDRPANAAPVFGVRHALIDVQGAVIGFEFRLAESVEVRLRRDPRGEAAVAYTLGLLASTEATLQAGHAVLVCLPAAIASRPAVAEHIPSGAWVCVEGAAAIAPAAHSPHCAAGSPTSRAEGGIDAGALRARGVRLGAPGDLTVDGVTGGVSAAVGGAANGATHKDPFATVGRNLADGDAVDFRRWTPGAGGIDALRRAISEARRAEPRSTLIACDLDSVDAIEQCLAAGATWASGRFAGQASKRPSQPMQADVQRIIGLLNSLGDERKPLTDLTRDLRTDAPLCYRLLRQVNSPGMGLTRSVDSIEQAVLVLGRAELQRWLSVLMLASVHGRPTSRAVQEVALARARLLELLAPGAPGPTPDALFTVGLLSLLDVMLQMPLEQALGPLRLSADASAALLLHSGPWHRWLALAQALERRDLDEVGTLAEDVGGLDRVLALADEAWQWASSVQRALQP